MAHTEISKAAAMPKNHTASRCDHVRHNEEIAGHAPGERQLLLGKSQLWASMAILLPTCFRISRHCAPRSGSFWLGRVRVSIIFTTATVSCPR